MSYILPQRRRSYSRFIVDASGTLLQEDQKEVPSIVKDVSALGVGLVTGTALTVDTKVEIVFNVPFFFAESVRRKAKVAWCRKVDVTLWEAGLYFGPNNNINIPI